MIRATLFLIVLLSCFLPSKGQENLYEQKKYGQLDGLLTQTVHCIHQDTFGYLILGTDNGVFLFDGHDFSRPKYHSQIESKRIEAIQSVANNEYLLMGGNPNCIYMVKDNEVVYKAKIEGTRNISHFVQYHLPSKNLYLKKDKFIYRIPKDDAVDPELHTKWNSTIISFNFDPFKGLYIWNQSTLAYLLGDDTTIVYSPKSRDLIWKFHTTSNDQTLAWTQNELLVLHKGSIVDKVSHKTPENFVVRNSGEYDNGNIWFTDQSDGLFEYNGKVIESCTSPFNLSDLSVTCSFKDENDIFWLGTIGNGLLRLQPSFAKMVPESEKLKITTMAQSEDHFLVGSNKGIFLLKSGEFRRLQSTVEFEESQEDVFNKNYTHQLNFSKNQWFISTMQTRPSRPKQFISTVLLGMPTLVRNGPSMHLFDDHLFNGFWGSFNFRLFKNDSLEERSHFAGSFGRTNKFVETPSGVLIICDQGIFLAKPNAQSGYDTLTVLDKDALGNDLVYNDLVRKGSDLYLATSQGVYKAVLNLENFQLQQVSQITFTESNCVDFVNANLWIGTSQGLLKYSNGLITPIQISAEYGDPFVTSLCHNQDNNKLLIGTMNGLFEVDPFAETTQDKILRLGEYALLVEGIRVASNFKAVQLTHQQNTFEIKAHLLNFLHPAKAELMYSLNDGTPKKGIAGEIRFNSLEAGDYDVKIWGETLVGQKTAERHLQIQISQPFWKQTWFILLGFLFIAILSLLTILFRSKQLKKRAKTERETQRILNELEKKALNLSLNPHFLFNSLNSIQSKVSTFDDEDLVNYIADFSNLMRKTLVNSDKTAVSIEEEIGQLELYLKMEQRRHSNRFSYRIDIPTEILEMELELPPMLLQPFVENAILHGVLPSERHCLIKIIASIENSFLRFTITDDGVGIRTVQNQHHESKGIDITTKRISLLHSQNSLSVKNIDTGKRGVRVEINLFIKD